MCNPPAMLDLSGAASDLAASDLGARDLASSATD
jgi:hypothetical protein